MGEQTRPALPAGAGPEPAKTGAVRPASLWGRLYADWDRHEAPALTALVAGTLGGVVCSWLSLGPVWAGFLVCYLAVTGLVTLAQTADA